MLLDVSYLSNAYDLVVISSDNSASVVQLASTDNWSIWTINPLLNSNTMISFTMHTTSSTSCAVFVHLQSNIQPFVSFIESTDLDASLIQPVNGIL